MKHEELKIRPERHSYDSGPVHVALLCHASPECLCSKHHPMVILSEVFPSNKEHRLFIQFLRLDQLLRNITYTREISKYTKGPVAAKGICEASGSSTQLPSDHVLFLMSLQSWMMCRLLGVKSMNKMNRTGILVLFCDLQYVSSNLASSIVGWFCWLRAMVIGRVLRSQLFRQ